MISLLYHSHTVVPAHLAELEALGLVEPDEQILVALDGVLLDGGGQRLSGPTLHDYCLVTTLRVILWARDYGRHLCCAFPLAELVAVEGAGIDPLHAQLALTFAAPEEDDQQFTLALLPLANLQAALTLLRAASEAARALADHGVAAREAGPEIMAVLGEQIYGHVDGLRPGESPYRWPGAAAPQAISPGPAFAHDPASLPPGQVYAAGRLARSAWDTLRRSIREAELPFELNSGSLRELTEAVRAINELVHTVASNPNAQQMAMAFLNRGGAQGAPPPAAPATSARSDEPAPAAPAPASYHEIPLRRRDAPPARPAAPPSASPQHPAGAPRRAAEAAPAALPDRRDIPLRRRGAATAPPRPFGPGHLPVAVSGSGDAGPDDRPSPLEDRP
ncbi:MAG TPA: hypothetical protein PKD53_20565 [Chloroflexaceae bacterium]|nr:hypothetical protein [Chloroflexaceae bacterium]